MTVFRFSLETVTETMTVYGFLDCSEEGRGPEISTLSPVFPVTSFPKTRVKRPQSNGIVERLHRTLLDEHFRVEGRKTWFETIDEMQVALDAYLVEYNTRRPHQGRGMNGRTPLAVFRAGIRSTTEEAPAKTLKTAA